MNEIVINLPNGETIQGQNPVVIIGPNGAGKTRLGVHLTHQNQAERIPASRASIFSDTIPMTTKENAIQEMLQYRYNTMTNYWNFTNDLGYLLSKLKAEDVESATKFRDNYSSEPDNSPETTKLMKLQAFWNEVFPGRILSFSGSHSMQITSSLSPEEYVYTPTSLSDGEKNVFYLAARVLDTDSGKPIIIDEPEIHLHPVLSRKVWDGLEKMRPDCRFIYITHDLNFALSRQDPRFIIIKKPGDIRVLCDDSLPSEVFEDILGAASFSIKASHIYFCEGNHGSDSNLYRKLLENENSVVIPVGSCREVEKCVDVINNGQVIKGVTAQGIIDRDYWPDAYFNTLPIGVSPLAVHEFESLFLLPDVFKNVCIHLGVENPDEKYIEFLKRAKEGFNKSKAKEILERAKKHFEFHSIKALNGLKPSLDLDDLEVRFIDALNPKNWEMNPSNFFNEEKVRIESALELESPTEDFLRLLPGKSMIQKAAEVLGVNKDIYMKIVFKLSEQETGNQHVISTIKSHLLIS
ncbi:AAA family ATPase [Priestia megaterium]|uniref:AAA family ATPase n=1 Tax=Priestia megaterium TaxID=1404 RepID=UPI000BFE43E1|nr:AAA family ATPase [Priestia megaterium]PGR00697.1 hypothetical protein COA23_24180 [Priestia megaterium]